MSSLYHLGIILALSPHSDEQQEAEHDPQQAKEAIENGVQGSNLVGLSGENRIQMQEGHNFWLNCQAKQQ